MKRSGLRGINSSTDFVQKNPPAESRKSRKRKDEMCPYCGGYHGASAPWWNNAKKCWSVSYFVPVEKSDGTTAQVQRNRMLAKGWNGHDRALIMWLEAARDPIAALPSAPGAIVEQPEFPSDGEAYTAEMICDLYLGSLHTADKLKPRGMEKTIKEATRTLKQFCGAFGQATVAELRKGGADKIMGWIADKKTWNAGTIETSCSRIRTAFNYAVKRLKIIPSSPVADLNTGSNRIRGAAREEVFTPKQLETIFNCLKESRYRNGGNTAKAFKFLLGTGCRPSEMINATAADVREDEKGQIYILVDHKSMDKPKWGGKRRPIRLLTVELEEMVKEAVAENPTGPLFRSSGKAWTNGKLKQAFLCVTQHPECVKLGLNEAIKGERGSSRYRYTIYTFRHTYANRLVSGADGIQVSYAMIAELMGNSSEMVESTYAKAAKAMPDMIANYRKPR